MIKEYSNKNIFASIPLIVNGTHRRIEFKGGTYGGNQLTPAKFRTAEKNVQDAIELHRDFKQGIIWISKQILEPGETMPEPKPAAPEVVKLPTPPAPLVDAPSGAGAPVLPVIPASPTPPAPNANKNPNTNGGNDGLILEFPEVENTQQARKAMKDNGVVFPVATKSEEIIAEAKKLGYKFPAWKAYNA